MFLTRIGFGSKAVITGDVSQIDLPRGHKSGLVEAVRILASVQGIAQTRFTSRDVVRHPLVARIVDAYEADQSQPSAGGGPPCLGCHGGSGLPTPRRAHSRSSKAWSQARLSTR